MTQATRAAARRGGTGWVLLMAGVTVVAALLLAACGSDEPSTPTLGPVDDAVGQELPSADVLGAYVGDVTLPDVADGGAPFTLVAEPGDALVVYFGFTSCPDICPTTLADLRQALAGMGDGAGRVDVAMVTIDPERDLDATLEGYLRSFVPDAHPLRTADDAQLRQAADAFGADYSILSTGEDVDVQHTAYLYAVDDAGEIAVVWPFGAEPGRIQADLERLLASSA